ncbi:DNA mismatch repair protein MutT [Streptomyces sp. CB03234]|uniref:NUDIX hydrolase n=1 Tax=Streptomyces sp. (strain CB03234) TaxID=1703937 RepID=UPI000963642D|nr:NUDIX hydrolase [Streptomyces sp. CB03234]OKJ99383.1 DNA mismatch repair protein MutT [Streptomyces sp. CB03234]
MTVVPAAGCVLWRRAPGGLELCLVHRPKYDDWSFPKGKPKRGEDLPATAVREVLEETGHHCRPGARLPTVRYLMADGRTKQVTYWEAEATGGTFVPTREVDRLLWLPPPAALTRLSHHQDRPLVPALLAALGVPG